MRLRRLVGAAIVAICIVVPLVETFDSWDRAPERGVDTEANIVIAALCVGLAFAVAMTIVIVARGRPTVDGLCQSVPSFDQLAACHLAPPSPTSSPPPIALRI